MNGDLFEKEKEKNVFALDKVAKEQFFQCVDILYVLFIVHSYNIKDHILCLACNDNYNSLCLVCVVCTWFLTG